MASDDAMDIQEADAEEKVLDISNPDVLTKYKCAAEIANRAFQVVAKACMKGGVIVDLCQLGDDFIMAEVEKIYTKGKVEKGIAFPTSVSVNQLAGHFTPLAGDKTSVKKGDMVKIDLGVHVDGYAALVAQTLVLQDGPITGRKADVMCACYTAAEAVMRLITPGRKNTDVTDVLQKCADAFKCAPLQGVLSHELKQFVIDGANVIISKVDVEAGHKVDEFEFETNQVYAIDLVFSSGDGKTRELNEATTVFKREVDKNYNLKMKASRYVLSEINSRFPTFPFTIRAFEDKRAKLGIVECVNHELVMPYPVLYEKEGEYVAQLKFTVLLTANGISRITGVDHIDLSLLRSEFRVEDEELAKLLAAPIPKRKKKRRKNKKKKAKQEDVEMES